MTREEEILKQTNIYTSDSLNYTAWCDEHREYDDIEFVEQAFISGAKWADKTMIEKACSILEDMTDGKLGKRFISEFKNKLKYGILERH